MSGDVRWLEVSGLLQRLVIPTERASPSDRGTIIGTPFFIGGWPVKSDPTPVTQAVFSRH